MFAYLRVCSALALSVCALAAAAWTTSADASAITWSTPVTISGDADVKTAGNLVYAYNMGGGGGSGAPVTATTINGVTFQAFDVSNTNFPSGIVTHGSVTLSGVDSAFDGGGDFSNVNAAPYNTLSTNYQTMLSQLAFHDGGPLTLTLGGLTAGQSYTFEAFVEDARGTQGSGRTETLNDGLGNSTGTITYNTASKDGGLGQYVIGTFVADGSSSQTINFNGNVSSQINGFELRTVPEPSSLILGGLGAIGLAYIARRRRSV